MTTAQWLFELHALRLKEQSESNTMLEVFKQASTVFRRTLVQLLGNDVIDRMTHDNEEYIPDETKIIPLALLTGNPNLMKKWLDTAQQEAAAEAAVVDDEFEELSRKLAAQDVGDLDPILFGTMTPADRTYIKSDEYKQALASLGIQVK